MEPSAPLPELPSLGASLAVSFLSLGLVCLLAVVALRWLSRRGVGQGSGPIRVLGRCPIEPKRSFYLVEAAGRCFLVGGSDGGMSLIAELDPKDLPAPASSTPLMRGIGGVRFAEVLARLRGAKPAAEAPDLPAAAAGPDTSSPSKPS